MLKTPNPQGKFPYYRKKIPYGRLRTAGVRWIARACLFLTLGVAAAASASESAADAAGARPVEIGSYEVGLQTAYSFGITNNAQMVTFFPRVGRVIALLDRPGPGVVTFGIEGMFSRIFETSHAMELGGGLLLRYYVNWPRVQPYAELQGGMLYSDLRHFDLSARVLFSCAGAVGLQVPLWNGLAATGGYRFRHISNAGQSRINPGLNSNLLAAGLSYGF